ncbi:SubName: Full=Uncharacterized protein {ECO:0000313/EMBL:CCA72444.1} [Serendipita indica DSM 11827]|nr:SubName: Full=Uncharacterized protein {ECO:0000313/EMBL:CCA72444.1} [Serendipita indica DSM 11827]
MSMCKDVTQNVISNVIYNSELHKWTPEMVVLFESPPTGPGRGLKHKREVIMREPAWFIWSEQMCEQFKLLNLLSLNFNDPEDKAQMYTYHGENSYEAKALRHIRKEDETRATAGRRGRRSGRLLNLHANAAAAGIHRDLIILFPYTNILPNEEDAEYWRYLWSFFIKSQAYFDRVASFIPADVIKTLPPLLEPTTCTCAWETFRQRAAKIDALGRVIDPHSKRDPLKMKVFLWMKMSRRKPKHIPRKSLRQSQPEQTDEHAQCEAQTTDGVPPAITVTNESDANIGKHLAALNLVQEVDQVTSTSSSPTKPAASPRKKKTNQKPIPIAKPESEWRASDVPRGLDVTKGNAQKLFHVTARDIDASGIQFRTEKRSRGLAGIMHLYQMRDVERVAWAKHGSPEGYDT